MTNYGDGGPIYEHPDDPYTITTRWEPDGFHVTVTAHILDGGDPTDVRAEAQRRGDVLLEHLTSMLTIRPAETFVVGRRPLGDDRGH